MRLHNLFVLTAALAACAVGHLVLAPSARVEAAPEQGQGPIEGDDVRIAGIDLGTHWFGAAVGLSGVGVHLAVLWVLFQASGGGFLASQALATWVAMTSNFFLNNAITYGDVRLRGAALWRGLLSFYLACGFGVLINLAVADWLYLQLVPYWLAGLAGAVTAAIWNFMTTATVTWGPKPKERAGR